MRFVVVSMHADQLTLTVETVRELVHRQFPAWSGVPIRRVESEGTVNAIFRLGERLAARFPLRPDSIEAVRRSLLAEAAGARTLFGRTRFATPEPVALGGPGPGYPLPWSVQTWLPGTTATAADPGRSLGFAHDLAHLIMSLRQIDTGGRTFTGHGRGGDLRSHDDWIAECFARSDGLLDVARLRRLWQGLRDLPHPDVDMMTHGDLIPGNVLVSDGRLVGILDVGGLGPADPALDVSAAWHLLEPPARRAFRHDLGSNDVEWERGKAWAFVQAVGAVWYYVGSNPRMSRLGRRTIDRILADKPAPCT